jgi:hypothetical protein
MDRPKRPPADAATPELRAAVRSQIVGHGETSSAAIAAALALPHATVVRILPRFEAVGCLILARPSDQAGAVRIVPGTLTPRFRDPARPLW